MNHPYTSTDHVTSAYQSRDVCSPEQTVPFTTNFPTLSHNTGDLVPSILTEASRNIPFPYDNPVHYVKYPPTHQTFVQGGISPPPSFMSSELSTSANNNDEVYYCEDLELVRQLQERTKTLMDASRCDSNEGYHYPGGTFHTTQLLANSRNQYTEHYASYAV